MSSHIEQIEKSKKLLEQLSDELKKHSAQAEAFRAAAVGLDEVQGRIESATKQVTSLIAAMEPLKAMKLAKHLYILLAIQSSTLIILLYVALTLKR